MKFLLVLTFAAVAVALPYGQITTIKDLFQSKNNERIINGFPAMPEQFPWQVAITYQSSAGTFFCGGSLINNQWVLTAAHCAQTAYSFQLKFGGLTVNGHEEGRVQVDATEKYVHPGYNVHMHNDIALIKLPQPIEYTNRISPIRLPYRGQQIAENQYVTVSGWGKTNDESSTSNTLNYVGLNTITNSECMDVYGPVAIISSTLCCKGQPDQSTCQGDSGGPLVTYDANGDNTLVGVVSFVHEDGCTKGYPSGYVRTEPFLDWIHEHTGIPVPV